MTRSEARAIAKALLKAGFHAPTICEDLEHNEIYVTTANRCWNTRTVTSVDGARDLLRSEGHSRPDGRPYTITSVSVTRGKTPSGNDCAWCTDTEFEPFDADDAELTLCRRHLTDYESQETRS